MPLIFSAIASIILAACGGGSSSEAILDALGIRIVESTQNTVTTVPAAGQQGTMCVYYIEEDCSGNYVRNGLNFLSGSADWAKDVVHNPPQSFTPSGRVAGLYGSNYPYEENCNDFEVGANGILKFYNGQVNGAASFRDNAILVMRAKNPHCTTDVKIKNVHLLAVLKSQPQKIYATKQLINETCVADGGHVIGGGSERITCNLNFNNAELRFDNYNIVTQWPQNPAWLNGGLNWSGK